MIKYGLYYKGATEIASQHINLIDMPTAEHAEAYFAGVKRLDLERFRKLFVVKEISENQKTLLYGNK